MKTLRDITLLLTVVTICSCHWAKDKAKETIHKGGEIVGKAGSEMADGVKESVQESFANLVEVSPALATEGIEIGRVIVSGTDSTADNIVSVYVIFHSRFKGKIVAKAIDKNKVEFGRTFMDIASDSSQAKYVDFTFDRRTNLDKGDKVILENF